MSLLDHRWIYHILIRSLVCLGTWMSVVLPRQRIIIFKLGRVFQGRLKGFTMRQGFRLMMKIRVHLIRKVQNLRRWVRLRAILEAVSCKSYKIISRRKIWLYLTRMGRQLQGKDSGWQLIASAYGIQILLTNVNLICRFLLLARKRPIFKWIHR